MFRSIYFIICHKLYIMCSILHHHIHYLLLQWKNMLWKKIMLSHQIENAICKIKRNVIHTNQFCVKSIDKTSCYLHAPATFNKRSGEKSDINVNHCITYLSYHATLTNFSCICNGYSANDVILWSPKTAFICKKKNDYGLTEETCIKNN